MTSGAERDVTIYDVAKHAGVSASTVSRTFSRPDRVSFKTAAKIRAAAEELGYRVDLETSLDAPLPSQLIGLIAPDLTNPFFQELLRGAEDAASSENLSVALVETFGSIKEAKAAVRRFSPHTTGLLLASTRLSNSEIQKIARTLPTVCLNRPVPNVPSVLVDNYDGAIKAAHHLYEQGARSITYVAGPEDSWADAMRWRGLLDTIGRHSDIEVNDNETRSSFLHGAPSVLKGVSLKQLRVDQPTIIGGRRAFAAWRANPTHAVMCFNDVVALGFMYQAQYEGVRVPQDVAVVGFDNTEITAMYPPGLTTVAAPLQTVGRVAAALLIALTKGITTTSAKPRVLPTRLIVRGSSLLRPAQD